MIYAFDFDGVIADSAGGWAFFCAKAWKRLENKNVPSVKLIEKYRPYISTAKEIYGLLFLLSNNLNVTRESIRKIVEKNPEKAQMLSDTFFDEKEKFINKDVDKFCRLYGAFRFIVPIMQNLSKTKKIYIVTSNKKSQVIDVLRRSKIIVKPENILDSTVSKNKNDLIKIVSKREKVAVSDILFVDDSLDHIKKVIPTGASTALASWGFVLEEDIKEAKKLGITILDRKNLYKMLSDVEYFDVIDKSNNVIGKAPRDDCHRKGLLHRAVHIMILNRKGEFLLQKRSKKKDLYSGWWTSSASGHVASGDDYDETAHRELKEELGVKAKLKPMFVVVKNYKGEGKHDRERIKFYIGSHDGPFRIDREEVDKVRFFTPKKINEMMKKEKFTPGTVSVLKELRKHPELLKRLSLS